MISYHNNSVAQAIRELFPYIGLDQSKFWSRGMKNSVILHSYFYYYLLFCLFCFSNNLAGIWKDKMNRRKFFEHYAKANEFEPEDKDAWYAHPIGNITADKVNCSSFLFLPDHILTLSNHTGSCKSNIIPQK